MIAKSCAILQPHYLPWLGYFEMIDRVDLFVFLDDVQFIKREWKNRNRIRKTGTATETKWITVPIDRACQRGPINEATLSKAENWVASHLASIHESYSKSPAYREFGPKLEQALLKHSKSTLAELNIGLLEEICRWLRIDTSIVRCSELGISGKREEKLRNVCEAVGANLYLANNATATYVTAEYFLEKGIGFETQGYSHPEYAQFYKSDKLPFIDYLSIMDLLFNHGDDSLSILRSGCPHPIASVETPK